MRQMFTSALKLVKIALARVPLLGRLAEVGAEGIKQAIFETLTTLLFATMPFWILPSLGYYLFAPPPKLSEALQKGEGLVFAAGLLGPLVYVITKRYGRFNWRFLSPDSPSRPLSMSFPYGGLFVIITALTCAIAGFTFAIMNRPAASIAGLNKAGLVNLSWLLMIGAAVIFFLVTAYRNMLDELERDKADKVVEEQPRQENAFLANWLSAKA
ncbi:MAG: hypothetical protein JHD35_21300 [Sphingopyxis sp.]|nr:hypothetical protein [Sphingopyxis sp.]